MRGGERGGRGEEGGRRWGGHERWRESMTIREFKSCVSFNYVSLFCLSLKASPQSPGCSALPPSVMNGNDTQHSSYNAGNFCVCVCVCVCVYVCDYKTVSVWNLQYAYLWMRVNDALPSVGQK